TISPILCVSAGPAATVSAELTTDRGMLMPKFRRVLAWFIDFALVVALASALAVLTFNRISALVTDVPELAARSGFDLLTSRGDVVDASENLGLSLWNKSVLYVEQ